VRHTLEITRRLKPGELYCIGMNLKRKGKRGGGSRYLKPPSLPEVPDG
jgi:hypothetical protein